MSFPQVDDAFWDWTDPVRFLVLNTTIADFEVKESQENLVQFDGVLQPLRPRQLLVKPENQRTYRWWTIWTDFELAPGQVVQDQDGFQFRIMSVTDWHRGGRFREYEAVQAPKVGISPPVIPA